MVMATKPHPAATQPAPAQSTSTAVPASSPGSVQGSDNNSSAAPVSPDNVGRLFVQQYYTVLNKAPHLLHRFYTKGSSFVHGRVDPEGNSEDPVYGQNEIYLKIMALDFRECYAKIRQVDSYATLGEGVVVQVTGELSTHGKPMRRFTQTFVLAPHSARNYYVRNDIFRYHDEVFQDLDVEDEENEASAEEEIGEPQPEKVEPNEEVRAPTPPPSSVPINTQEAPPSSYYSPPPSTVSNGTNHLESPVVTPPKVQHPVESRVEEEEVEQQEPEEIVNRRSPPAVLPEEPVVTPSAPSPPPPQPVIENHQEERVEAEKPETKEAPPAENKIVSWADKLMQNTANPPSGTNVAPKVASSQPQGAVISSAGPKQNESFAPQGQRGSQEGLPQRDNRRGRGGGNWARRGPDGPRDGDRGRGGAAGRVYPDNHQLFVGNLPQDIKDDELKEFFSKHGKVVEMRINRNANPKLPFFGFIVFDDPGPVQNILNLRTRQPILFRDVYRLNVEEKKPKGADARPRMRGEGRPNSGGPPPRGGSAGRGSGRVGQGMGPPRMGRGFNPQR